MRRSANRRANLRKDIPRRKRRPHKTLIIAGQASVRTLPIRPAPTLDFEPRLRCRSDVALTRRHHRLFRSGFCSKARLLSCPAVKDDADRHNRHRCRSCRVPRYTPHAARMCFHHSFAHQHDLPRRNIDLIDLALRRGSPVR